MTETLPWHDTLWQQLQRSRSQGRLAHALLLAGSQGLGKQAFARRLARSVLCEQPDDQGNACGHCRQCLLLQSGNHPDLRLVTPEEGSSTIRIDSIRDLVGNNTLSVGEGAHRVFIIEPAHAMGAAAANALLKTLEEPIPGTLMLLVSTAPEKLPITIRSRCQLLRFSPPDQEVALDWLHRAGISPNDARLALRFSGGAPLRARELTTSGAIKEQQALLEDFLSLAWGRVNVPAVAESWLKQQALEQLLLLIAGWLLELVRNKLAGSEPQLDSPLQNLRDWVDLKELYVLLDRLNEIRRMSANNLNAQLALESVLLQWGRITKGVN
ncbi:DNA polymerase III subunit delta' [Thiolapillus brandeum]|uniref:DNA polymerase III subunit delta' n=1 Tax=Thiolapillus brandeum TaxID=1076588 RepID=A0A7U6JI13_9GAMM|nr:DNA polymerase III subunit delta' [Thiolapillus brandeum]BAO44362.1 DNA polymerase III delta' subunit [Thiolapillus brandeum]